MKFVRIVLQVNTRRLTESDFRFNATISKCRPWRHFIQKSAATWWVKTKRLPGVYAAAFDSSWSKVPSCLFCNCCQSLSGRNDDFVTAAWRIGDGLEYLRTWKRWNIMLLVTTVLLSRFHNEINALTTALPPEALHIFRSLTHVYKIALLNPDCAG